MVAPLTDLLKAKAAFVWTSVCQEAFEAAKSLLVSAPVLAAPQFDRPFSLCVDSSNVGAGAVLLQAGDAGIHRPVSYFSKKFSSYQLNYSVIEKEALALIWALQNFEVYVGSVSDPLVVYTDHNPLIYLHSFFFLLSTIFILFFTQHNITSKIKQNKTADTYSTSQGSIKREGERKDNKNTKVTLFK